MSRLNGATPPGDGKGRTGGRGSAPRRAKTSRELHSPRRRLPATDPGAHFYGATGEQEIGNGALARQDFGRCILKLRLMAGLGSGSHSHLTPRVLSTECNARRLTPPRHSSPWDRYHQIWSSLQNVSKLYRLYRRPVDRLHEMLPLAKPRHTDFWALQDISFEVDSGEMLGLVGPTDAARARCCRS
ncbi:MAG: hypothetical protein WDO73_12990 [Ignavibacteriota bacterium]